MRSGLLDTTSLPVMTYEFPVITGGSHAPNGFSAHSPAGPPLRRHRCPESFYARRPGTEVPSLPSSPATLNHSITRSLPTTSARSLVGLFRSGCNEVSGGLFPASKPPEPRPSGSCRPIRFSVVPKHSVEDPRRDQGARCEQHRLGAESLKVENISNHGSSRRHKSIQVGRTFESTQ
jgi:hypothetical protein